ncbi:hypothetical protein [Vibrio chagasii]|uniref:hypothetical protein n=1 Tax=Vibrio chagasii TaxID=170679 RepID=UPI00147758E2|nr:hypothetical protein [Vibrio chagasii]
MLPFWAKVAKSTHIAREVNICTKVYVLVGNALRLLAFCLAVVLAKPPRNVNEI